MVVFSVFRTFHHQQITQFLASNPSKKDLEQLHLTRSTFNALVWRRPNKEFEHNNNLYDVVRIDYRRDSVSIICYKDTHEKNVERYYAAQIAQEGSDKSRPVTELAVKLGQPYILHPFAILEVDVQTDQALKNDDHFNYLSPFSLPHLSVDSPPPNISI